MTQVTSQPAAAGRHISQALIDVNKAAPEAAITRLIGHAVDAGRAIFSSPPRRMRLSCRCGIWGWCGRSAGSARTLAGGA